MAILNTTTLNNLRTTIRGEFNIAFKNANANSLYKRLATTIVSSSKTNTYDWLGKFPQMREWVGQRVVKDMTESSYQITNKKYESTLGVDRADIEDDNLGLYSTIAQSMGQEANDFLDRKVAALLKDGFNSLCYDGQNFFDDSHPVYPKTDGTGDASLVSNIYKKTESDAGTPWYLLSLNVLSSRLFIRNVQKWSLKLLQIRKTKLSLWRTRFATESVIEETSATVSGSRLWLPKLI